MSQLEIVKSVLEKTARRRRWERAWRGAWFGLLAGSLLWVVALTGFKLTPISESILAGAGLMAGLSILGGFVCGWCRSESLLQTARWIDSRRNLQERLSTTLEMAGSNSSGKWGELLATDAARCVQKLTAKQLLPFGLPETGKWALLTLIVACGLGFVPEYRSQAYLQTRRDAEIIRETGRHLAELTRRSLEQRPPALEPTRKALDQVADLGEHLTKAQLTRSDALKDLASVTEKLKAEARDLGKNPALKPLERASRTSNRGGASSSAELHKQIDALREALGNKSAEPEALEKFKQKLQQAKQAASGLPDKDGAARGAAKNDLAQSLSNLSKEARDIGLSLPSLDEAIEALAASQIDQLLKDLDVAETSLEKLQAMAQALEQLQMSAQKLGKDLAEQLQNGQAEAAQGTLEKMVAQLKSSGLTPDQLKPILDEVSKAVTPAGQYGKVADYLKQGAKQMQGGDKMAAAQSLADAAKELENLMAQLEDAQSLMATLEALQRAQMAIGNGQKWGQSRTPRAGQGGGVGAGVGTWADDSQWLDISEIKDRWDNSGVVRPDEDPRGKTDRGDAQLADNLAPTKVKGQINPGGPMPSITLRGVSIKGMSKVDFKEVATAAQSDAQSALSQDQVPRAYQSAVRDYFDDLKK
jgi:uncharacterized protein with von Willebrand factor type A (vWA) domain